MTEPPDRPMFSVIMPVYNHAAYVGEAIASVRAQTFVDWELIVVDDGSTDGSADIIDRAAAQDRRIRAFHQPNAGPAAARNHALRHARGPWLAYLDSDDVYYPDTLRHYAEFIAAHPEAGFLYGYRHRLNDDGSVTELPGEHQDRPTGAAELFQRMYLSHLCVCYRRELIDKVGGYDQRLRSVEDYDLYLRMSSHTRFHPLGRPTGLRRRHATNLSRQSGYSRSLQAAVLERFIERGGGRELLDEATIRRRLGQIHYAAGRQYFKTRCFVNAIRALKRALEYRNSLKAAGLLVASHLLVWFGRTERRPLPELS